MASLRKIESARANGAKSHGPKTEEGKRKSSMNALKHGLTASTILLSIEDEAQFQHLRDAYLAELQPQGVIEEELVEQMIVARWRQTRLWHIETALLEAEMLRKEDQVAEEFENADDTLRLAAAFDSLARDGGSLAQLQRHEARLRRQYERALRDLKRLQADRPAPPPPAPPHTLQNEPNEPASDGPPKRGLTPFPAVGNGCLSAFCPSPAPDSGCDAVAEPRPQGADSLP